MRATSQERIIPDIAALLDLAAWWIWLLSEHTGTHAWLDTLPVIIQHQPLQAVATSYTDTIQLLAGASSFHAQVRTTQSAGGSAFLVDLAPRALHRCKVR